jgi:hypothetical protein
METAADLAAVRDLLLDDDALDLAIENAVMALLWEMEEEDNDDDAEESDDENEPGKWGGSKPGKSPNKQRANPPAISLFTFNGHPLDPNDANNYMALRVAALSQNLEDVAKHNQLRDDLIQHIADEMEIE